MRVLDTTLREGCQRWRVYFPFKVKKGIAKRLIELGVEEIEIGVVGEEKLKDLILSVRKLAENIKLSVWLRLKKEDIEKAAKLPEVGFNLGVPVSHIHLERRLRLSFEELFKRVEDLIGLASRYSPCVTLGLEDASRAEKELIFQICKIALSSGAKRIRISDTLGIFTPLKLASLVKELKKKFPKAEIGFHGHNDFGLATANAITALIAGADWVDVSVLGLGERAGIAPLEEVVVYLYFQKNKTHYRIDLLPKLSRYVASYAGEVISEFKPVIGRKLFYCESGLHVEGLKKAPELYEPFPPEALGLKRKLSLGAKSGRAAVKALLKEWKLKFPEEKLEFLVKKVRNLALKLKRPLDKQDLKNLLASV